ncbi:MAG TPA: PrsW family glutamic-type intramembrane protease [Desulfomonilaceae bacterium]|nr:PrsW family glutamic-type intramembrane protease [Desulfomonilaceae bacterium]
MPILGLLPGLIWLAYSRWKNGYQPGSFEHMLRVFVWGCACTIPSFFVEQISGAMLRSESLPHAAISSFFLIAPSEEFFKLVAVWIAIYRSRHFREPLDGIIYAATAALGFACIENVMYMAELGGQSFVSRALYATPAHVLFSSMWGYSMGLARFKRDGEFLIICKGFLLASGLHGIYNFLVAVYPKAAMVSLLPLMVFMAWLAYRKIQDFRTNYPFPPLGRGVLVCCPDCGAYELERSEECSRCGSVIPVLDPDAPRFCSYCRTQVDPSARACSRCGRLLS